MKEYLFDRMTGEFIREQEACIDPLESRKLERDVWMISANGTTTPPPEQKDGYVVIWNGSAWEQIEDHRGTIVWKSYEESMEIKELGAIPEGWSAEQPEKPVTADDYDAVMEAHLLATRVARGYTLREPSPTYDDSPNVRWASDAADWKAFFTAVMEYGLAVMNEYAATGKAPSLNDFKAGLPQMNWTIR